MTGTADRSASPHHMVASAMMFRSMSSYDYMDDAEQSSDDEGASVVTSRRHVPVRRSPITKLLELSYTCSLPINDDVSWKPPKKTYTEADWKNPRSYTTWDGRDSWIWDISFDDPPGTEEIVFGDFGDDDDDDDVTCTEQHKGEESVDEFFHCLQISRSKEFDAMSDATIDTEDETVPYCSSPEFPQHHRYNHHDEQKEDSDDIFHRNDNNIIGLDSPLSVELSPIPLNPLRCLKSVDSDGSDGYFFFQEEHDECDLMACITDLRDRFQLQNQHNNLLGASSDSSGSDDDDDVNTDGVLHIEESKATLAPTDKHRKVPEVLQEESHEDSRTHRYVRFADEVDGGTAMETVFVIDEPKAFKHVYILLPMPSANKFEFVHAEYSTEERTSIGTILQQLPQMASIPGFSQERYFQLVRPTPLDKRKDYVELINALSIHDYELHEDEVLVAVANGCKAKTTMEKGEILLRKIVLQAVMRNKRYWKKLQRIKTDEELEDELGDRRSRHWYDDTEYDGDDDRCILDGQDSYDSTDSLEAVYHLPQPKPTLDDSNIVLTGFEVQPNIDVHNTEANQDRDVEDESERNGQDEARCVAQDDSRDSGCNSQKQLGASGPDRKASDHDQACPTENHSSYVPNQPKSRFHKSKAHHVLSGIRPGKLIGNAIAKATKKHTHAGVSLRKASQRSSRSFEPEEDKVPKQKAKGKPSWTSRLTQKRWKPIRAFRGKREAGEF